MDLATSLQETDLILENVITALVMPPKETDLISGDIITVKRGDLTQGMSFTYIVWHYCPFAWKMNGLVLDNKKPDPSFCMQWDSNSRL